MTDPLHHIPLSYFLRLTIFFYIRFRLYVSISLRINTLPHTWYRQAPQLLSTTSSLSCCLLLFGQMPLCRQFSRGPGAQPSRQGFIFIFEPALDFQEPKVQIAAGFIQPFHKQFSTMRFVQNGQVSRPLAEQHHYLSKPSWISFLDHISLSMSFFSEIRRTCKITYLYN